MQAVSISTSLKIVWSLFYLETNNWWQEGYQLRNVKFCPANESKNSGHENNNEDGTYTQTFMEECRIIYNRNEECIEYGVEYDIETVS